MNLSFDNNWRRVLLLTKQADRNIDRPVSYIALDIKHLPKEITFEKFCSQFSYDYKFDYDLSSRLLWSADDNIPSQKVAEELNKIFPKCASIINRAPSAVHNLLSFFSEDEDLDF